MSDLAKIQLNTLYENHFLLITNKLKNIVGCQRVAEDLAQEAYLRVSTTLAQKPIEYLQPYLYQTARNLALDHLRREQTRQGNNLSQPQTTLHDTEVEAPDELPCVTSNPEKLAIVSQQVDRLQIALEGLSERRREILILSKVHKWRYQDIAKHFGISVSAVEKNIMVALAHCLEANED